MTLDLYPRVLGREWSTLAEPVRRCHRVGLRARGRFTVTHGSSLLARLVAWVSRFPPAGSNVRLRLVIRAGEGHEIWQRHFGAHVLETTQYPLPRGRVGERQGPLEVCLRLRVREGALDYRSEGAALRLGRLRIPLPGFLAPKVKARAWAKDDVWMRARIEIRVPVIGLVLKYEGRLKAICARRAHAGGSAPHGG